MNKLPRDNSYLPEFRRIRWVAWMVAVHDRPATKSEYHDMIDRHAEQHGLDPWDLWQAGLSLMDNKIIQLAINDTLTINP